MTICMSEILCITNRHLCTDDFFSRIDSIARARPHGIILREKDLREKEYEELADEVMSICDKHGVECILHTFSNVAQRLGCKSFQAPLYIIEGMKEKEKRYFENIGASCHSIEDAIRAESSGCTYIMAGHIFDTDCKKDIPGRGIDFLKSICNSIKIPVYAVGGIDKNNVKAVTDIGASGICIMKSAMVCQDISTLLEELK